MTSQQTRLYAVACAAALAVRGSSALSASATNCAELAPFTTGEALAEDSWLFLADNNNYACDEVRVAATAMSPALHACVPCVQVSNAHEIFVLRRRLHDENSRGFSR